MPRRIVKKRTPRKKVFRQRNLTRFQIPEGTVVDYKNFSLLLKFVNDRGKIVPRRISGVTAKEQRNISASIKNARFLALLPVGGYDK
ncbi:MAG: 30S ribosomal protein S18 [Candidatus Zapsychrus exili]|nr:30S ribosomal protein S18 [Candidatus Zapsychrus exili]